MAGREDQSRTGPGWRLAHPALLAVGLVLVAQAVGRSALDAVLPRVPASTRRVSGIAPAASAPASPEPLTAGDFLDGFPDWSPDGRQIAFMRDGRTWVMAADGSAARPLAAGAGTWDIQPSWSPDGRWLAFVRHAEEGRSGRGQILRVRADGTREEVLYDGAEPLGYLAWQPGGQGIAFTTRSRLLYLDLRTRKTRALAEAGPDSDLLPGGVAWTPDGQSVVFGAGRHEVDRLNLDLFQVRLAGGEPVRLTTRGGIMPHVAPDGRRVAFRSPHLETGIAILDLTTRQVTLHLPDQEPYLYFHPRWSPDGARLLASRLALSRAGDGVHATSAIVVLR